MRFESDKGMRFEGKNGLFWNFLAHNKARGFWTLFFLFSLEEKMSKKRDTCPNSKSVFTKHRCEIGVENAVLNLRHMLDKLYSIPPAFLRQLDSDVSQNSGENVVGGTPANASRNTCGRPLKSVGRTLRHGPGFPAQIGQYPVGSRGPRSNSF